MRTLRLLQIALFLISASVLWPACGDDSANPDPGNTTDNRTLHAFRDVDYVHNKFFSFDLPTAFIGPVSTTVKVYRTVLPADLVADPTIVQIPGWAVPDSVGCGDELRSVANQLSSGQVPTHAIEQQFKLLEPGVDYTFVRDATNTVVGLELTQAIPNTELRTLAVSYQNVDGWLIGGTYAEMSVAPSASGYPDKLLLEMIKAPDPSPQGEFKSTWALEMRHIYDLGFTNILPGSLDIEIVDILRPRAQPQFPDSTTVPYLQIFGLDQTDAAGTGAPDGKIDLTKGFVDLDTGRLYFPELEAFHPNPTLVNSWTAGQFSFTGPYAAQYDSALAIYHEKLTPTREWEVYQYIIRVLAQGTVTQ